MKSGSTFEDWNFDGDVWKINNDGKVYPKLPHIESLPIQDSVDLKNFIEGEIDFYKTRSYSYTIGKPRGVKGGLYYRHGWHRDR